MTHLRIKAVLLVVGMLLSCGSGRLGAAGERVNFDATFTKYEEFEASEYQRLLPAPSTNTWYNTRLKAECRLQNRPETPRAEDIVLVTLNDCNELVGIHKAYLLARQRRGAVSAPFQVLEVFDQAQHDTQYVVPEKLVHRIAHVAPDNASFDLVNLTGSTFPDIVVRLWFSGGSYVPLYVAVVQHRNQEMKIALRAQGGLGVFDVEKYRDLDGDGRDELLIPEEITVAGVDHASCPTWVSCYRWRSNHFALANELFYRTDSRVEANLLKKYEEGLKYWSELRKARDYFEEYEYYLGLTHLYRGDLPQASWFLRRVVERAEYPEYARAAASVLVESEAPGNKPKPTIGPWLMELQLGQPMANLPQVDPAELEQAPPEIKAQYEQQRKQFQAEEHLKQLGTNVVPALLAILEASKDLNEKEHALIAIDHLRPPPQMVVGALAEYLNQGELAETAALVLARQGPAAIGPLISSRTNRVDAIREAIAWHLADFHPDEHGDLRISVNSDERVWPDFKSHAAMISPALLELLKDEDPTVRFRAALSLGAVGGDAAVIVPALVQCLKDKERTVRGDAAAALGKLGKAAQAALPALTECLHDPDETVRREAAFALNRLK